MRLRDTMSFRNIKATAAGAQATVADPRSADEWIKNYLDKKNKRLNDLRRELNHLLGPEKGEWHAAYREDKKFPEQNPGRVGGYGPWCVVTPEGEILSRWSTKEEATTAAWGMYKGLKSSTGATAGAQVKRLDAADVFQDPDLMDKTRSKFKVLQHPKPRSVRDADTIRMGDNRPSSHGQGAAGTGGAGAGGAGGGVGV